ncbi:MAG: peptidoglycan-binding domain-containing protein [Hyphomicrobiaceae bacterium]
MTAGDAIEPITALGRVIRALRLVAFLGFASLATASAAEEQSKSLLDPGQVVVTGFSGSMLSDSEAASENDATKVDETFINVDGAVARVVDISGVSPGNTVTDNRAAEAFEVTARDIGQVFGIALDRATSPETGKPAPNIYLGASSAYGLHIVVPDRDGDGWPKRVTTGDPEAQWMEGLFGTARGGGPGTIWKIDGVTGEITKFADITDEGEPNSGAGLGNLTYDAEHDLIYVSDLETGKVYRLNMQGEVLDSFDHGVEGREAEQLPSFEDDPNDRADITSPQFKSDDPTTWGYAQPPRRVWGVKVYDGRLYYAVAEGPEIWSIALGANGEFDGARREIALPPDVEPYEIADISFTSDGVMILAQRPPVTGSYDYVTAVATGPARVLRYKPGETDEERWVPVPEEYSVGERGEHRNTSGGIALGYAFKEEGGLDYERCEKTLWTTGESLLQEATRAIKVEKVPGFATSAVDGLQGNDIEDIRVEDSPPKDARYVDYDGSYVDNGSRGHLGDVEIPYHCAGESGEVWQPEYEVAWWSGDYASDGGVAPELDLAVEKRAVGSCKPGGICRWEVIFSNRGDTVYYGPAVLTDTLSSAAMALVSAGPAPWGCAQYGATLNCHRPAVYLKPGRHLTLSLSFRLSSSYSGDTIRNCAKTNWLAGEGDEDIVRAVQMELALRGYYTGEVDGIAGKLTADAIETFEADAGMDPTGEVSKDLITALFGRGAYRGGDANPDNDEGCAEHAVDDAYKPKKIYEPKLVKSAPYIPPVYYPKAVTCEPGYFKRGGECIRICPPGTWRDGNRCIYTEPVTVVCYGGKVPTEDGDCVCPVGMREIDTGYRTKCVWPERIRCYGGRVIDGDCYCPERSEPVKTGRRSYVCLPIRDETCIDGAWRNGRCECPLNRYLVQIDSHTFQCVRRTRDPVCFGGFADNGRCYCPDRTDPVRLAPGIFKCARKDDGLTCIGGWENHGQCQCSRGYDPVRLSRKVYECRPGRGGGDGGISCINGSLLHGQCTCSRGDKLVKISDRLYRCESDRGGGNTHIICKGGDVVNGKCVCPSGMKRQSMGDLAYQCVKDGSGTRIRCENGDIVNGKCVCGKNDVRVQFGPNAYRCKPKNVTDAITCVGGRISGSRCLCPQGSRAVISSANAYRCVTKDGESVGGGTSGGGATTQIACAGGQVQGNQCVCPKNTTRQRLSDRRYRCVANQSGGGGIAPQITCAGGKLDGRTCVCPSDTKLQKLSSTRYKCVAAGGSATKITCVGGTVSGNRCICPQGSKAQVTSKNAYRCVTKDGGSAGGGTTTAPKIACAGGVVQGTTCVCPANAKLQKLAANKFRCVPKKVDGGASDGGSGQQQKITCVGGSVKGKRCVCGQGQRAQQVGKNAYQCVSKGGQQSGGQQQGGGGKQSGGAKIVCAGGQAVGNSCACPAGKKPQALGSNRFRCVNAGGNKQQQGGNNQQGGNKQQGGNQQKKSKQQGAKVVCMGGALLGNRCRCPQGQRAVQAGANIFRCVAKGG